ncbi:hypothetical protein E2C01_050061 [Portunus trituberculatus]|uniref:Uncharacterized protein n=1 Tax=Portunus trituberculatus TaxID=210409 RepID=A0A5B7GG85_PORTR|nr:hypothetical protein [Portunus trituberculatus]
MVEKWNALNNEVVTAQNVHNFKEKLDKWRHGDMETGYHDLHSNPIQCK